MGGDATAYVQLVAQSTETFVWLVVTLVCLARARRQQSLWAALGAVGAVLLFLPAFTTTSIRVQLMVSDSTQMLQSYSLSPLPTIFPMLRVAGAVLLLTALLVGRRPADRPLPSAL